MVHRHLDYEETGRIASLELNRPEKRNALSRSMLDSFGDVLSRAEADDEIRVVVISGAGSAFCAGMDIDDLGFGESNPIHALEYLDELGADGPRRIEGMTTPVIAKVDGPAVGGGCELATLCDVTVASKGATFQQPEGRLGHVATTALTRWPTYVGSKRTADLLLTGRQFSADEAYHIGLVSEVVPPDALDEIVRRRAEQICRTAPQAIALIKRYLNGLIDDDEIDAYLSAVVLSSADAQEGAAAFAEQREPDWDGR